MNFQEFADKWIKVNVSDDFHPGMSDMVRDFVALIIRQRHSGSSMGTFLSYISSLMSAYYHQGE